jgi:hypothetical protein
MICDRKQQPRYRNSLELVVKIILGTHINIIGYKIYVNYPVGRFASAINRYVGVLISLWLFLFHLLFAVA